MKILFKIYLIVVGASIQLAAQNFSKEVLQGKFKTYRETHAQEKIFLQTDRELYLTGELMWVNLFCVDASLHHPTDISMVAYIEVLDRNNTPVLNTKIKMTNGKGSGSLFMPTSLSTDNYVIRAYTRWMRNFSPEFYFHKIIGVVNPFVKPETSKPNSTTKAEFFPEGGTLINSRLTKVAYRISSSSQSKVDSRGFLLAGKDTVTRFTPSPNGVGSFELVPDVTKNYQVLIKSKGPDKSFFEFPKVLTEGYAMRLTEKDGQLELVVNNPSSSSSDEDLTLFVHTRNAIVKNETTRTKNHQITFLIDKKELPEGVSHFTIFSEKGKPECQRLYFRKPENLNLEISAIKSELNTREKNSIQLSIPTQEIAKLSISISKIDSLPSRETKELDEFLLLYSDLGTDVGILNDEEIDNFVLTRSWQRFKWDNVFGPEIRMEYLPEPNAHVVYARVTDNDEKPREGVTVYLSSPDKIAELQNGRSDKNGIASFEVKDFFGSHKLIAQTNRTLDSTSIIKIQNPFSDKFASISIPQLTLTSLDENRLLARSVRMQAQNIFFEDFENQFSNEKIDSIPFYGKADEVYKLDDYTRFTLMEEVMREYVPGVVVRKRKDGFNFWVLDKKRNSLFRETPLILLDGVPLFDADEIMQFDPLKVKRLEVVTAKYFHGNLDFPGIVSYMTYQGDMAGFPLRSKNGIVEYEGLQRQRKFYSPSYTTSDPESRIPDPRYLLYWNPDLVLNGKETSKIEFFSSDVPGTYLVKIEGMTASGKIVRASTTFKIVDR